MPQIIIITPEAEQALRSWTPHQMENKGKLRDGMWFVPVENDTYHRMLEHLMEGETISDMIIRLTSSKQ